MLERLKAIGAMPVLCRLDRGMHLALHRDLKLCVETYMSQERQQQIRYKQIYLPCFDELVAANSKVPPSNERAERNGHIEEADASFRRIRRIVEAQAAGKKGGLGEARILREIIKSYESLLDRKSMVLKIAQYPKLIARLLKQERCFVNIGIKSHVEELSKAIECAEIMQNRIVVLNVNNAKYPIKRVRNDIDVAYRGLMMALNSIVLIEEDTSDIQTFIKKWTETLLNYRNAFAAKEGARIKRVGESEVESAKKKERYYTLPKPKTYIAPKTKAASSGNDGNDIVPPVIPPASEIPLYDPNKHFTEYKLGDLVRIDNGDIYMVINLGHVHYHPDSKYGHYGWRLVG